MSGVVVVSPQVTAYLTASMGSLRLPSGGDRCSRGIGGRCAGVTCATVCPGEVGVLNPCWGVVGVIGGGVRVVVEFVAVIIVVGVL